MKTCLDPIIDSQSRVVILGTLPGGESLRLAQYYADPANGFWRMLDAVFEETIGESYAARVQWHYLKQNRRGINEIEVG